MNKKIKKIALPSGWYPQKYQECFDTLSEWDKKTANEEKNSAFSVMVPHAGWYFSGFLAFKTIKSIRKSDVIVIAGGHLRSDDPVLFSYFDGYDTPLGVLESCNSLLERIEKILPHNEDCFPDNTVEVHLPFVKYLFPDTPVCALRIPPDLKTLVSAADIIYKYAAEKNISVSVIGSTDLTHYGENYGFTVKGSGREALDWVKNVNDKGFIDRISACEAEEAVRHSELNYSACSAGAAALAAYYGKLSGVKKGSILDHFTSFDVMPSSSFVGYCGIRW